VLLPLSGSGTDVVGWLSRLDGELILADEAGVDTDAEEDDGVILLPDPILG
jgi:hypothetical protein